MIKILFICHGNICRSTMAEFVMKHLVNQKNLNEDFYIESKATSTEEIGNPPHPGTLRKMKEENIPVCPHYASQMTYSDYKKFDLIIGMDRWNYTNIMRIIGSDDENKVHLLLDFTKNPKDIADPWYTGNFDETFFDVMNGCTALLSYCKDLK